MPSFENEDGFLMNYAIDGAEGAPWIVLSNSLGAELAMWEPQLAQLAKHYRVLRYDTRGHGESDVTHGNYTIEMLGADVIGLMDHLDIQKADFCGVSMGGLTGIWLGIHHPQRVGKLVLANTAAKIGTAQTWQTRMETVGSAGMGAIIPGVLERWFTAGFRDSQPEKVAAMRAMLANTVSNGYMSCCAAIRDADLREDLGKITAPTLVIASTHDQSTPAEDGQYLAAHIGGARYVEFDAAHISNWEQAAAFNAAIGEFLGAA